MEFIHPEIIESEIIFKKIVQEDFLNYHTSYHQIVPNDDGFISDILLNKIDFEDNNTVVINAGVGQGKTTFIKRVAKDYFQKGFVVVFAVPYKSLIGQYKKDLLDNVSKSDLVDYEDIIDKQELKKLQEVEMVKNEISPLEASKRGIHLMTVNALLGNPGEDAIMQAEKKIEYLNHLIERCKVEGKKVIWIFDEIHDSIHNFKQILMFNLWKWREVIFKTFCISATYNEASKLVLKYLAELTNDNIQIIESERLKIPKKRSKVTLIFNNKNSYNAKDDDLINFFEFLISEGKNIDILTYSKTFANEIMSSTIQNKELEEENIGIGKLLKNKFKEINLCTADTGKPFDNEKCNIGTTFSTGISIEKNNAALVIFMPPASSYNGRYWGIFKRGINTIIQSLARQRTNGDIYIITPAPNYLIGYIDDFGNNYCDVVRKIDQLNHIKEFPNYEDINQQDKLILNIYNEIKENFKEEIDYIDKWKEERLKKEKPRLEFPTIEDYILSDGEKALAFKYDIFGKNPSAYLMWALFNDQFLNCRLENVVFINNIEINEKSAFKDINEFVFNKLYEFAPYNGDYSSINNVFEFGTDTECYSTIRKALYKNVVYLIKKDGSKTRLSQGYMNGIIERAILGVIQYRKKACLHYCNKFFNNYIIAGSLEDLQKIEYTGYEYSTVDYLMACFKNSEREDIEKITSNLQLLKNSYNVLYKFLKGFKSQFTNEDENGKIFFSRIENPLSLFKKGQYSSILEAIEIIKNNDPFLKNKVFSIFQNFKPNEPDESKAESIIKFFRNSFFVKSRERIELSNNKIKDNRADVLKEEIKIPDGQLLNFLFTSDNYWNECKINSY